ncbi:hypothetical protein [Fusibacter ferrireducens]|uniref:Outer membrane lipoprotein-sorting protein n=1 Tax=Fusibacter ferrireducens TaxID=2785058 RepID=A0ABR9ZTN1_9FIRM|nr:hypothetical protein [Fusibacter ferrireducens]MBF4693711.1 hypothetical protein [Fusibacter ferrireducens]
MKKNIWMILMIAILTALMFGCASETTTGETKELVQAESTQTAEQAQSANQDSQTPEENATQTANSVEAVAAEPEVAALDRSLEGTELLNSLSLSKPKSMRMVMETSAFGTKTMSTMYYDGDNSRTETVVEGVGTSVVINNAKEKVMYNYVEGTGQGVKIIDADLESAEDAGLMMDMSTKLAELTDASSEAISARVETLDGEEVVYIEATEADDEMGNVLVKMWYSTQYSTPLKYEVIAGEQPMMTLKVVEIESNIKVDANLFQPASDIEFQEVNMEAMMNMMD